MSLYPPGVWLLLFDLVTPVIGVGVCCCCCANRSPRCYAHGPCPLCHHHDDKLCPTDCHRYVTCVGSPRTDPIRSDYPIQSHTSVRSLCSPKPFPRDYPPSRASRNPSVWPFVVAPQMGVWQDPPNPPIRVRDQRPPEISSFVRHMSHDSGHD